MELFLVLGAIVLIAITVWIVWPARTTSQLVEVPAAAMHEPSIAPQGDRFEDQYTSATADLSAGGVATALQHDTPASADTTRQTLPSPTGSLPQGAPATRATGIADGGGLYRDEGGAELRGIPTQDPVSVNRGHPWPEADTRGEHIGVASRSDSFRYPVSPQQPQVFGLMRATPFTLGIGAGALLSIASAIGGAWLYARWQRQRQQPLNRLRRRAKLRW